MRDEPLFEVSTERVLVHLSIQGHPTLVQERRGAEAEHVVVGVCFTSIRRGAERTRQEGPAFWSCGGFFARVVTDRPVPFMEKFFIVAPGALREVRQVEDLGREVQRDVFPDGRVAT